MPDTRWGAALWTFEDLVAASGGTADGAPAREITGFSIDTRTLAPGEVFVALVDQRDGHDFVTAAFERGAAAAIVAERYRRAPGDGALIRVDDPLCALERIGKAARARLAPDARVIAVTGSAGKTGTKEMLRAALSRFGATHAADKSFNNHWGVPLTLARTPKDVRFAVFEIGMSHAGEITPLTRMVRPHIAIVTNVLPVHVGNFSDGETGIANAKAEIFAGLEPGGTAIVLRDSPHFARLVSAAAAAGARVLTFGTHADSDLRLVASEPAPVDAASAAQTVRAAFKDGETVSFPLGVPGAHIAINALAVVLALRAAGCDMAKAVGAFTDLRAADGRGARWRFPVDDGELLLIDESYNANPASMAAAMTTAAAARRSADQRLIFVLGDMLELGEAAGARHVGLAPLAAKADRVFAAGPHMKLLFEALPPEKRAEWGAASGDLVAPVLAALRAGDIVMVKGSFGSRMAPIVAAIKKRFADAGPAV
jgi:UDP-N-acetylmuramoyl-tripeptide--D-alanyl-D-alanine ligase